MTNALVWADSERDVVLVQGSDSAAFLHSQLAQNISSLEVGGSAHSLLLEPTGHVHSLVRVVRHADDLFTLDVDAGFAESVITRLQRFVLRSKVTLTSSDWKVRSFRGDGARASLQEIAGAAIVGWGSDSAIDVVGQADTLPSTGEQTESGHIDMIRVDLQWPRLGTDILVGDIPATTGVVSVSVSFTKGCYPGQELVERMDSRGADAPVNLRIMSRDGVGVGSRVEATPQDTGTVTSVGFTRAFVRVGRGSSLGEPLGNNV
jgi:hypothetical protein